MLSPHESHAHETAMPTAIMALGVTLLGHALQISDGFYDDRALLWLLLAILCCTVATLRGVPAAWLRWNTQSVVVGALVAGISSNLIALAASEPGRYLEGPYANWRPLFLGLLATAAVLLVAGASGLRAMRRWWFPLMLGTFAALGIWMIAATPNTHVDVVTVYQFAAKALRHGRDPYTMTYPNIYGSTEFYPPGAVVGGRVLLGFPYPPLSLLLGLPGLTLGDVRYAELAALVGAAALIGFSRRGLIAPLAATLMLFTPRGLFVLEQAWTEPLTLLTVAATIYTAINARRALPIALGLLIATKQYAIIALPLAWLLTRPGQRTRDWVRMVGIAILVAAIITLPFVFWNVDGFVQSVFALQFRERFRGDSLSLLAWLAYDGVTMTSAITVAASGLALLGGLGLSLWRANRTTAGFAAAIAFTLLLVFICSKKAFCNYYFFALGVMCAAIAAESSSWSDATDEARDAGADGP